MPRLRTLLAAGVASTYWPRLATAFATRALSLRWAAVMLACCGVAWLCGPLSPVGLALLVSVAGWVGLGVGHLVYPHTTRGRVRTRYGLDGFAGFWELHRHLSAHHVRSTIGDLRPSLAEQAPESVPATECGTFLGRSMVGPVRGTDCYASFEDVVGIYAAPRAGKTALLGSAVLDHCGAVACTSTKLDLYLSTARVRGLDGGRWVRLFNPDRLGDVPSTLRWDPLEGCADRRVARTRASHLIGGVATGEKGDDSSRMWDDWATGVLSALLMTAARSGLSMADVASWVFNQAAGAKRAQALLRQAFAADTPVPPLLIDALGMITTTEAVKTRDSIFMILRTAVGFMEDEAVADVCCPRPGNEAFDVAEFVAARGTLYLVGAKDGQSGPLRAALLGHLFETAKTLSATYPGERLDPPLMLALDEVALNPVPLDSWLPDAGGRGIHILWALQSPAQAVATWGRDAAAVIEDCTNHLLIFGGLKGKHDLDRISDLCGTRLELVPDPDGDGPGHARYERRPVVPPEGVRTLVKFHPLLIAGATKATIVAAPRYFDRVDVRAAGRVEKPVPRPELVVVPRDVLEEVAS